jgi:murein hydrolase activator
MVKPVFYILLLFTASVLVIPQSIDKKKKELNGIKSEINSLEKELQKKSKSEKRTLELMENLNKQNFLLNKLINKYRDEEADKEDAIAQKEEEILMLERETKFLKYNYSRYIVSTYKYGMENELNYLITSKTLDQAYTRFKYLKIFSDKRQADLVKIKQAKEDLARIKENLSVEKNEKQELADAKLKEEAALEKKLADQKKLLASIKDDKNSLAREIDTKRKAESSINNMIASLVAKEEKHRKEIERKNAEIAKKNAEIAKRNAEIERKKELALAKAEKQKARDKQKAAKKQKPEPQIKPIPASSSSYDDLSSFASQKGKLKWPISGAKVARNFGENKNQKLKTITLNYGIDLLAKSDISVKCVAEGVVSAIDYVPGYGSVIIVTHKGDYRTVYSHLSQIFVREGKKLKPGTVIGKVGESLEGNILHFEIWNNRNHQNPSAWLAKR